MSVQTKPCNCPSCGKILSGASGIEDANLSPKPGDYSICAYCFIPLMFTKDMRLMQIELSEIEDEETRNTLSTYITHLK